MNREQEKSLVIIGGPTGIGKSALSYHVQMHLGCYIISADSRQVYKEMRIGTAKPSAEDIRKFDIKFCDYVSIHDNYNAGRFVSDALMHLDDDFKRHPYSIVCGGTGMYLKALTEGLDDFPKIPEEIEEKWNDLLKDKGIEYLQAELKNKDPKYALQVDLQNPRRLVRALSVIDFSGRPFSSYLSNESVERPFTPLKILLDLPRKELYQRIENRVDLMITEGLLDEARRLYPFRKLRALDTVGYKELFAHLENKVSLDEAISLIKTHTRQYAKRQITWNRKYFHGAGVFHPEDVEGVLKYIDEAIL